MTELCPISGDLVDERATRIAAYFVVVFSVLLAWLAWQGHPDARWGTWVALALAADFLLRALAWRRFSPIAQTARLLHHLSGLEPRRINSGPKRFAAVIGFLFSLAIFITALLHLKVAGLVLALILTFFAALESFFGFCVACRVYPFIHALRSSK